MWVKFFGMLLIAAVAAMALVACETTDRSADDRYLQLPDIVGGEPVAWPFRPVEMRIHPLTRLATDEDEAVYLEVRIEFRDADGHTTRGLGELIVALHTGGLGNALIDSWRQDLTDLSVNAQRFDDVTRTYLLRLRVDPANMPVRPELRAVYHAADGRVLTAEYRLGDR
jgi:hypothetical protein